MWYGEMYKKLLEILVDIDQRDYGNAQRDLSKLLNELKSEGLIIHVKLEKGGDENYEGING